jgi:hypothetical protein
MKKVFTVFTALIFMILTNSCDKAKDTINELTEFDIDMSANANIPAATFTTVVDITQPLEIETPEIPTNATEEFSKNKTSADLISEIKVTRLTITTTAANMDYIKSISINIKSGSTKQRVARKDVMPTGVNTVSLDLDDVNIKDYISKDKISFQISALLNAGKIPNQAQELKIDQRVRVKATLIK